MCAQRHLPVQWNLGTETKRQQTNKQTKTHPETEQAPKLETSKRSTSRRRGEYVQGHGTVGHSVATIISVGKLQTSYWAAQGNSQNTGSMAPCTYLLKACKSSTASVEGHEEKQSKEENWIQKSRCLWGGWRGALRDLKVIWKFYLLSQVFSKSSLQICSLCRFYIQNPKQFTIHSSPQIINPGP